MGCFVHGSKNGMGCFVRGDKNCMGCFVRGGKSMRHVLSGVSENGMGCFVLGCFVLHPISQSHPHSHVFALSEHLLQTNELPRMIYLVRAFVVYLFLRNPDSVKTKLFRQRKACAKIVLEGWRVNDKGQVG